MQYCDGCDNIFGYDENLLNRTIEYLCIPCDVRRPIDSNCLFREQTTLGKNTTKKYSNFVETNHIKYDKTLPIDPNRTCNVCELDKSKPSYNIHYFRNNRLQVVYMCNNCDTVCE
jgi:hypothetical protein